MNDDLEPRIKEYLVRSAQVHIIVMDRIIERCPDILENEKFLTAYSGYLITAAS